MPWETVKWRSRVALAVYALLFAATIVLSLVFLVQRGAAANTWALVTSLVALGISIPLTCYDINAHVQNYVSPLQRYYIRIIFLVPLYSLNCWFALAFKGSAYVFNAGRECYEAYVLFSLGGLLLSYLDWKLGEGRTLDDSRRPGSALHDHLAAKAQARLAKLPPDATPEQRRAAQCTHIGLSYMALPPDPAQRTLLPHALLRPAYRLDSLVECTRLAIFQYVLVRCLCAGATLLTAYLGCYCEGSLSPWCAWPYIFLLVSLSQFTAAWWVFVLYVEFHDDLARLRPLGKILSIKFVLFLSFWQSGVVSALEYFGVLAASGDFSGDEVAGAIQNYAICWEMAAAAVAHHFCFNRAEIKQCTLAADPALPLLPAQLPPNDSFLRKAMPFDLFQELGEYGAQAASGLEESGRRVARSAARTTGAAVAGVAEGLGAVGAALTRSPRGAASSPAGSPPAAAAAEGGGEVHSA